MTQESKFGNRETNLTNQPTQTTQLEPSISYERKRDIADKIKKMSKDAYLEIYFFIKTHNINHTITKNGVFCIINNFPVDVFEEFEKLVLFCYNNEIKYTTSN
jgi:hypothetical protein